MCIDLGSLLCRTSTLQLTGWPFATEEPLEMYDSMVSLTEEATDLL